MTELFNVSLDYLAFDNREEVRKIQVADREFLVKLQEIDQLSEADKTTVKAILDTFIKLHRFQRLASEGQRQPASP